MKNTLWIALFGFTMALFSNPCEAEEVTVKPIRIEIPVHSKYPSNSAKPRGEADMGNEGQPGIAAKKVVKFKAGTATSNTVSATVPPTIPAVQQAEQKSAHHLISSKPEENLGEPDIDSSGIMTKKRAARTGRNPQTGATINF